ncbi:MAG: acyl-CoA thioesterase [Gemmatimonadaceae bacterium]
MKTRPFVVQERVRWGDCDPMGIIRYDAYTRFFELGEAEMFRAAGIGYREFGPRFGITLPRRVMHMDFLSPPLLDELLEVEVYISSVGTTSLTLNFDVYGAGGELCMAGHLVVVCAANGPEARVEGEIVKVALPAAFLEQLEPSRMSVEAARAGRGSR